MTVSAKAPKEKSGRDLQFAKRINAACDDNPDVPPLNHGRLSWIVRELQNRNNITVTQESARKWLAGESYPRNEKMRALAALLKVERGWLAFGMQANAAKQWNPEHRADQISGAKNVVAGLIQMTGGSCVFPDPEDNDAGADIIAIVGGVLHKLVVIEIKRGTDGEEMSFDVPSATYRKCHVIGVSAPRLSEIELFYVPRQGIEQSTTNGPLIKVVAKKRKDVWAVEGEPMLHVHDFAKTLAAHK